MASENSPRGQAQIILVVGAVVLLMLICAGVVYLLGGSHGLQVPGSSPHASGH